MSTRHRRTLLMREICRRTTMAMVARIIIKTRRNECSCVVRLPTSWVQLSRHDAPDPMNIKLNSVQRMFTTRLRFLVISVASFLLPPLSTISHAMQFALHALVLHSTAFVANNSGMWNVFRFFVFLRGNAAAEWLSIISMNNDNDIRWRRWRKKLRDERIQREYAIQDHQPSSSF